MAKDLDRYYEIKYDNDGAGMVFDLNKYTDDLMRELRRAIDEKMEVELVKELRKRGWDIRGKHPIAE